MVKWAFKPQRQGQKGNFMKQYKIYYMDNDANYPEFDDPDKALKFYLKEVMAETGENENEILNESWCSPRGVEKCVQVKQLN